MGTLISLRGETGGHCCCGQRSGHTSYRGRQQMPGENQGVSVRITRAESEKGKPFASASLRSFWRE